MACVEVATMPFVRKSDVLMDGSIAYSRLSVDADELQQASPCSDDFASTIRNHHVARDITSDFRGASRGRPCVMEVMEKQDRALTM